MQTVNFLSDVEPAVGSFGYSVIRRAFTSSGVDERLTLWFIRDRDGYTHNALILPADTQKGAF